MKNTPWNPTDPYILMGRRVFPRWQWWPGTQAVRVEEPPFVSEGYDASKMLGRKHRVLGTTKRGIILCHLEAFDPKSSDFVPDLTDPATVGCLLPLIRIAWNAPSALVYRREGVLEPMFMFGRKPPTFYVGDPEPVFRRPVVSYFDTGFSTSKAILSLADCNSELEALVSALERAPGSSGDSPLDK